MNSLLIFLVPLTYATARMGNKKKKKGQQERELQNRHKKQQERAEKVSFRKQRQCERWKKGDAEYKQHFRELSDQIAPMGLTIRDVDGDGACLFRSLAIQLFDDESKHGEVRQQIVAFLRREAEQFSPFFIAEEESFDDYCRRMSSPREWGGHLELQAASLLFGVNLQIFQLHQARWDITNAPPDARTLRLSYHNRDHYASVSVSAAAAAAHRAIEKKANSARVVNECNQFDRDVDLIMQSTVGIDRREAGNLLNDFGGDVESTIEYFVALTASQPDSQPIERPSCNDSKQEVEEKEQPTQDELMVMCATNTTIEMARAALRDCACDVQTAIAMLSSITSDSSQTGSIVSQNDTEAQQHSPKLRNSRRSRMTKLERKRLTREKKQEKMREKAMKRREKAIQEFGLEQHTGGAGTKGWAENNGIDNAEVDAELDQLTPEELREIERAIEHMDSVVL